jgi:hypothetical protein
VLVGASVALLGIDSVTELNDPLALILFGVLVVAGALYQWRDLRAVDGRGRASVAADAAPVTAPVTSAPAAAPTPSTTKQQAAPLPYTTMPFRTSPEAHG